MYEEIRGFGWSPAKMTGAKPNTKQNHDMLSAEEETALWQDWQSTGNIGARNKVLTAHLPLCWKLAHDMARKNDTVPLFDLYGIACETMTSKAHRFDLSRGNRFSSLVITWVQPALNEYIIRQSGPVSLATTKLGRYIYSNYGRIKEEALAGQNDCGLHKRHKLMAAWISQNTKFNATAQHIAEYEARFDSRKLSLDVGISQQDEDAISFIDLQASDDLPEDRLEAEDYCRKFALAAEGFNKLPERSRHILKARLLADNPVTLHELGNQLGLTAERVRQIESAAIKKLQEYARNTPLPDRPKPGQFPQMDFE